MTYDVFPKSEDMGARTWGNEILLVLVPGKYTVKRLEVRAGEKGGLQYHHLKDEVGVMISGEMIVRIDNGSGELIERIVGPGDVMHFAPGLVQQTEAITDVVYIEASTPHFNDRVRVESRYGLELEEGLPSTSIEEVIEK
jgi:mannose-6-phosphate isomerase-like protein (cupin superfamily)